MLKKISSRAFSEELINSLIRVRHSEDWATQEISDGPLTGETPRDVYAVGDSKKILDLNLWLHGQLYEVAKNGYKSVLENDFDVQNPVEVRIPWSVMTFEWREGENDNKEYFLIVEDENESTQFRFSEKIIDSIESRHFLYFYCADKKTFICSKQRLCITDAMKEYIASISGDLSCGYKMTFLRRNTRFQNVEYELH